MTTEINILSIVDSYECNRIKDVADIEDLNEICLNCNLQVTCKVKYLLDTQKRATKLELLNKILMSNDRRADYVDENNNLITETTQLDQPNACSCEDGNCDCEDEDRPKLRRARSILIKRVSTAEVMCCQTKKVVRFADSLGLELVSVKCIQNPDSPPRVPPHVIFNHSKCYQLRFQDESSDDMSNDQDNEEHCEHFSSLYFNETVYKTTKTTNEDIFCLGNKKLFWKLAFEQPSIKPDFYVKLYNQKVLLESFHTRKNWLNGVIRVLNVTFQKQVKLRYTIDNWSTHKDVDAVYISNSSDGQTDRFSFRFTVDEDSLKNIPTNQQVSSDNVYFQIEFAVCFESGSGTYWDNNNNQNYKIDCCKESVQQPEDEDEIKTGSKNNAENSSMSSLCADFSYFARIK